MSRDYAIYQENHDITFIMREQYDDSGFLQLLQVVGFYFGPPDDDSNRIFQECLSAKFD